MSAFDFTARALAIRALGNTSLSYVELAQANLPESITRVDSAGHTDGGLGAGTYIADSLADAALFAAHPWAVFAGADGRYFRLVPGANGCITPEQLGCPLYSPGVNQQPYIQAAIEYAEALGYGVAFPQSRYELWTPWRVVGHDNVILDQSGVPVVIRKRIELRAAPGGTTFRRRNFDGSDPNVWNGGAGVQLLPDNWESNGNPTYWRGGMVLVHGLPSAPADYNDRPCPIFRGTWVLDGGIERSANPGLRVPTGSPVWYVIDNDDGEGWDVSDKGLRHEENSYTAGPEFDDLTITGFRGEGVYRGGSFRHGRLIGKRLEISQLDGSALDLSVQEAYPMEVDMVHIHHVFQPCERGWGHNSRIGTLFLHDCNLGCNFAAGHDLSPIEGSQVAIATIDFLHVARCGTRFTIGSGMHIREALGIDTGFGIGRTDWNAFGVRVGTMTVKADRANVAEALNFASASNVSGTRGSYDNVVGRLTLERTPYAKADNKTIVQSVRWLHSLGDRNYVGEIVGEAHAAPRESNAVPDFHVGIGRLSLQFTLSSNFWNAESAPQLAGGRAYYPLTASTSPGHYAVTLPSAAMYPSGARIVLENVIASGVVFSVQTANTRMERRLVLQSSASAEFEKRNGWWHQVTGSRTLVGSSATVTLQKGGADIPPNGISDEVTFTVNGARAGMRVLVTPVAVISGEARLVGRVTADNTVGIRAQNMSPDAPLAIGATAYRVELEWPN